MESTVSLHQKQQREEKRKSKSWLKQRNDAHGGAKRLGSEPMGIVMLILSQYAIAFRYILVKSLYRRFVQPVYFTPIQLHEKVFFLKFDSPVPLANRPPSVHLHGAMVQ